MEEAELLYSVAGGKGQPAQPQTGRQNFRRQRPLSLRRSTGPQKRPIAPLQNVFKAAAVDVPPCCAVVDRSARELGSG
jgi:hypothetical protein